MDNSTLELIKRDEELPLLEKVDPETIIGDGVIKIIAKSISCKDDVLIRLSLFDWHWDDFGEYEYLTLNEIKNRLLFMCYKPPFYVWHEQALSGVIYEYENTKCNIWLKHGETKGYA